MNNHLIPKLILRRFSDSLNVYDLETGKLTEGKNISKTFREIDKYTKDIEDSLNKNIESQFANLLDQKILGNNKVIINRIDLHLIKRYLLTMSIRTLDPDYFFQTIKFFEEKANLYIMIHKEFSHLPTIGEIDTNAEEYYLRTLNIFSNSTNIKDIANNPLATREMIAWGLPFLESYIAFWDAPEGREYVITDNGMSSEYEGFYMLTGGISLSKDSYLNDKIKKNSAPFHSLLATTISMYENYNIFVISSTRLLVMINPFFSLYDKNYGNSNKEVFRPEKPDIWPAIIQDQSLFERPSAKYVYPNQGTTYYDEFTYNVKTLTEDDLVYVNYLLLSQAGNLIAFNDIYKVLKSIMFNKFSKEEFNTINKKSIKPNNLYQPLIDKYQIDEKILLEENSILFRNMIENILLDYNSNEYLIKTLIDNSEKTIASKNLDFIGKGSLRIYRLKNHLKKILQNKKE